jgi:hypothetical protein
MPWTGKQKGFFGARCGDGEQEYCDLLKHQGSKKDESVASFFGIHEMREPPPGYVLEPIEGGVQLTTPNGNVQRFRDEIKARAYAEWHASLGARAKKIPPKMEAVFHIREAPVQNRPPPGSQVVKPTDWTHLGATGQNLKQGLDGMKTAGQEMTAYATPDGQRIAYPKDAAPGRGPMRADDTKGVWTAVTGSAQGVATPPTPLTTTVMK